MQYINYFSISGMHQKVLKWPSLLPLMRILSLPLHSECIFWGVCESNYFGKKDQSESFLLTLNFLWKSWKVYQLCWLLSEKRHVELEKKQSYTYFRGFFKQSVFFWFQCSMLYLLLYHRSCTAFQKPRHGNSARMGSKKGVRNCAFASSLRAPKLLSRFICTLLTKTDAKY